VRATIDRLHRLQTQAMRDKRSGELRLPEPSSGMRVIYTNETCENLDQVLGFITANDPNICEAFASLMM
jgi:hypothetical protein